MDQASHGPLLERIPAGLRRRILPAEPPSLSRERYEASLHAVLLLGASLGVQLASTAMAALGPLAPAPPADQLTAVGRLVVTASYDIPAYAAACLATVLLMALLLRAWSQRLGRADLRDPARAARLGAALHAALAVASLGAYLAVAGSLRASLRQSLLLAPWDLARLAAPTAAALVAIAWYHAHWLRRPDRAPSP